MTYYHKPSRANSRPIVYSSFVSVISTAENTLAYGTRVRCARQWHEHCLVTTGRVGTRAMRINGAVYVEFWPDGQRGSTMARLDWLTVLDIAA